MRRGAALFVALSVAAIAACGIYPAWLEPEEAGPDFPVQGEYAARGAGAQVVALGGGSFRLVHLAGGLPGAGWDGVSRRESTGERSRATEDGGEGDGGRVVFEDGSVIEAGVLRLAGDGAPTLARVERASRTAGIPAPPGAVVLFSEAGLGEMDGRVDARGLLAVGAKSLGAFGSAYLHVEFRTPFMPSAEGQARANSGVYLQERYEVQILDSFGNAAAANECGALYEQTAPAVAMAFPPLAWQTYDIDFTAARFDAAGTKTANARVSVLHNGVLVHDDVELEGPTGLGDAESPEPGALLLQDHATPVFFRNVWLLPKP